MRAACMASHVQTVRRCAGRRRPQTRAAPADEGTARLGRPQLGGQKARGGAGAHLVVWGLLHDQPQGDLIRAGVNQGRNGRSNGA